MLQANCAAIDAFVSKLVDRLLNSKNKVRTQAAQTRTHDHPSATDFYHKWNLAICYQLRFGLARAALNKILLFTQEYGCDCNNAFEQESFSLS